MISGIYKITNIQNKKFYIGSTSDFYIRRHNHLSKLRKGNHPNPYLQNSWNKYGKDSFKFETIAVCPPEYLIKLEQWFIDNMKPIYNILHIAGTTKGRIVSEKEKNRLRKLRLGSKLSDEHKKNLTGRRTPVSDEEKRNLSQRMKTRKISDETRKKMSLAKQGKPGNRSITKISNNAIQV